MSIGSALSYPFQNPARLFGLALAQSLLVFTLPVASDRYLVRFFGTDAVAAIVIAALFVANPLNVIWLHGYGVAVVRSVLHGDGAPPRAQIRRNLREGCLPLLSTLVYAGPVLFVFLAAGSLVFAENPNHDTNLISQVFFVIALIALIGLGVVPRIVYVIGFARYAATGRSESLVDMAGNAEIARRNLKTTLAHSLYQAILVTLFALLAYIMILIGNAVFPAPDAQVLEDMAAFNRTAVEALALTLGYLWFWHASTHLHAQYAQALGIGRRGEVRSHFRKSS